MAGPEFEPDLELGVSGADGDLVIAEMKEARAKLNCGARDPAFGFLAALEKARLGIEDIADTGVVGTSAVGVSESCRGDRRVGVT